MAYNVGPKTINYQNLVKLDELAADQMMTEESAIESMGKYLNQCVEQKADLQAIIEVANGDTCLHKAIKEGRIRVIKALHLAGVNWEVKNAQELTPRALLDRQKEFMSNIQQFLSHYPIKTTTTTVIQLKAEKPLGIQWENIFSSLSEAEILNLLKDPKNERDIKMWRGKNGETIAHLAACKGTRSIIEALLEIPINLQERDNTDQTPLHYAATHNNKFTTLFLVQIQSDVEKFDNRNYTPIHNAIESWSFQCLNIILEKNYLVLQTAKTKEENTELHLAALKGNLAAVSALLYYPIFSNSINTINKEGFTALEIAARGGHLGIVKQLMQRTNRSFRPHLKDVIAKAADLAEKNNHPMIKSYLLGEKISQPIPTYEDLKKSPSDIKKLINLGLDPMELDAKGRTILHRAIYEGLTDLVYLIIEQGGGIPSQVTKPEGFTALYLAQMTRNEPLTKYLKEIFYPNLYT